MKKFVFYAENLKISFTGLPVSYPRKKSTYARNEEDARAQVKHMLPDRMRGCLLMKEGSKETLFDKPWMT